MDNIKQFFPRILPVFGLNMNMGFLLGGFVALLPFLREDFGLTRAEVGLFTTSLFGASLFTAIFAGNLIDRIGVQKSLFIGGIMMGISAGLFGFSPFYSLVLFFALFVGLGECILTPAGNKAIMDRAGGKINNPILGLFRSGPGFGALIGASLLPALATQFGWRPVSLVGPIIFVGLSLYIFFRGDFKTDQEEKKGRPSLKGELKIFLGDSHCRFAVLLGFSFAVVLSVVVTYLPLWLHEGPGLSLTLAGIGLGVSRLGGVLGRPFWGYLADLKGNQEKILLWEGGAVALIVLIFSFFGSNLALWMLMLLAFSIGFAGMGFEGVYFGFLGKIVGIERTGTMTGLALTFFRLAVMTLPPLFGFLADKTSSYSISWLLVSVFPVISIIYYFLEVKGKKTLACNNAPG